MGGREDAQNGIYGRGGLVKGRERGREGAYCGEEVVRCVVPVDVHEEHAVDPA